MPVSPAVMVPAYLEIDVKLPTEGTAFEEHVWGWQGDDQALPVEVPRADEMFRPGASQTDASQTGESLGGLPRAGLPQTDTPRAGLPNTRQLDLLTSITPTDERLRARAAVDTSRAVPLQSNASGERQADARPWWLRCLLWVWQVVLQPVVKALTGR